MEDDEVSPKLSSHVVGMGLDTMSIDELQTRIATLEAEINRLREAIEARQKTRSAADSLFKL